MAFVLFVFLMASSVLLAGFQTRLQPQAMAVFASAERLDIPMIWASVGIEAVYGAMLILIGLWFGLQAKKQKQSVLFLTSIMLMCFGATGSHLCVSLIAVNNAANAWIWYGPVYGLRTLGMVALGWLTVVFPDGRFVTVWSRWLVAIWATTCLAFLLFPWLPFNFVYGAERPWLLDSSAATLLSVDSIWRKLEPVIQICIGLVFAVTSFAAQFFRFGHAATGVERQQLRWFWLGSGFYNVGMLIYFGFRAIAWFLQQESGSDFFVALVAAVLAAGFSILWPACLVVAFFRPAIFELRLFSRDQFFYFTTTVICLSAYAILLWTSQRWLQFSGHFVLVVFGGITLLLMMFVIRDGLNLQWSRRFIPVDDPLWVLKSLQLNLEATRDPAQILPDAARTVASALRLPFVRIVAFGSKDTTDPNVVAPSLQTLAEIGRLTDAQSELQQYPFVLNGSPVGVLEIMPRGADDPLTRAELRLLETVVGQLGTSTQTFMLGEDLRRANAQLLEARESERQRLRDDLHDGVLGALSGMKMKLGVLEMQGSSELLSGLMRDLEHTQSDVRRLVNDLHPSVLEALGLRGALEQFVGSHGGLRIELRTEGITSGMTAHVPLEVQSVALRIAQEAITNVIKHSRAQRCMVSIRLETTGLLLEIEDDGVGLPVLPQSDQVAGQGLRSMRERALRVGGLLEVEHARNLGGGTRVRARLPFRALGSA